MARFALLVFAFLAVSSVAASERVALVIGNGAYVDSAALANPVNDAKAVAEKLKGLGFEPTLVTDAGGAETIRRIGEFTASLSGARLAMFYFAGHGIQIGGQNFLLPTDVSTDSEWALRYSAINVQEIVREMEARTEVSLVVLDACRDNPFAEQLGGGSRSTTVQRGLSPMHLSGKGAIIAYAAAAGRVASDGAGPHSPYTEALLAEIESPGVEVGLMLRRVAGRVIDATQGQQRPELLVRLIDEVYLNQAPAHSARLQELEVALPSMATPSRSTEPQPTATVATPPASETSPAESVERPEATPTRKRSKADRRFFGRRLIEAPDWYERLRVAEPTGWRSAPPVEISEVQPGTGFSTARTLPLAAVVETRIAERGQELWYRIEAPTAGEVRVTVPATPEEIDIFARVWNADREVVAKWQGAARPGGALKGIFPVPAPGSYWIEVRDGSNNGASPEPFRMTVDFRPADDPLEPNTSIGRATPVPVDAVLSPTIFPEDDRDWLAFWIDRPGLFTAEATGVPANLDIAMRVRDYNGDVIRKWATPAREGGDTFLDAGLAAPGRYFLEIVDGRNDAASVDPFTLTLAFEPVIDDMEPNNSFGEASLQPSSGEHMIAIFPEGDTDWIALDVDHPGQLSMSATDVPEALDVHMRVWDANKSVTRKWFGPARPGGDVEGFADLAKPGRYFIEVADGRSDASSPASFPLTLVFTPQPDQYEPNNSFADAKPLTLGGEILFNILPEDDQDWFRIEVPSSGELSVIIDPSPENLDLHYRVWDADREVIRKWVAPYRMGGVTEGFADLPRAGTYFLEIADGRNDERSIEHAVLKTVFSPTPDTLEPNNSFGSAKPLPLGTPHTAYILPENDRDWLRLDLDRPGSLEVAVENVDESLEVAFRLWTEDGDAGNWHKPARPGGPTYATLPITAPGAYRLEITDWRSDARSANGFTVTVTLH